VPSQMDVSGGSRRGTHKQTCSLPNTVRDQVSQVNSPQRVRKCTFRRSDGRWSPDEKPDPGQTDDCATDDKYAYCPAPRLIGTGATRTS
jgi:hypothetical protein